MKDVEVLPPVSHTSVLRRLPDIARDSRLPADYRDLYNQLLTQSLLEFPPIEGYETMHVMLAERATYFFCRQKADENEPVQPFDLKRYKANVAGFLRTVEALLKEARSISAEVAFKHNFVRQVVEIIDRSLPDTEHKRLLVRELGKLASS